MPDPDPEWPRRLKYSMIDSLELVLTRPPLRRGPTAGSSAGHSHRIGSSTAAPATATAAAT
jgi:hypothetical protein